MVTFYSREVLFAFSFLLQDVSHPGVAGLLIHTLKENVNETLAVSKESFS